MISVSNLSYNYGPFQAVKDLSFEVSSGDLMGFLGSNGAGKTTTMRVLTGFLPPSSGTVNIAGFDIAENPHEAQKHIGYLAENNPLYTDLRVNEFLSFRAKLKGVSKNNIVARVKDVIEKCWLGDVQNRLISQLSKGYRQRVGFADALVHSPPILILDEPTVGLDPHQIIKTRELVKALGKDHTIMLSSHILSEVEMLCDTIVIIHEGKLLAQGRPDELRGDAESQEMVYVSLRSESEDVESLQTQLEQMKEISSVVCLSQAHGLAQFQLTVNRNANVQNTFLNKIVKEKWDLQEISFGKKCLEDIFVELTCSRESSQIPLGEG
jgi:ABC-2 type transport system ATP-binding protein